MVIRSYIEKFNTIMKDSDLNVGINPIGEINYGHNVSRMLVYFDCNKLLDSINSGVTPDIEKFSHRLKIANCGSIEITELHCGKISDIDNRESLRASSFDVIFFLIPKEWDGGKGFDYKYTYFNQGFLRCEDSVKMDTTKLLSNDGATWYQAKNGNLWEEEGVYSSKTLSKEYDKFGTSEGSSIIIARQHFDIGIEDISVDITDTVNKFLSGELKNYGIGIAFTPLFEDYSENINNYVGFFTHKTNTFFEPFLESVYCDHISDDRANFILNKDNKLYLYCNIGGNLENLDEIPTCSINDKEYEVFHPTKGIYGVNIKLNSSEYKPNTMLYDTWGNIKYNGTIFDDVELDFTTKKSNNFFEIGNSISNIPKYVPEISGIKQNEHIYRGDIRKIVVLARVPYTSNKAALVDDMRLRLYVKDGTREINVIYNDYVNKSFLENYYYLDTSMLIPNKYYIDITMNYNGERIEHHDILEFSIVDNLNNKYY